jgi:hypothetical protein
MNCFGLAQEFLTVLDISCDLMRYKKNSQYMRVLSSYLTQLCK